jgi:hypothetical protein
MVASAPLSHRWKHLKWGGFGSAQPPVEKLGLFFKNNLKAILLKQFMYIEYARPVAERSRSHLEENIPPDS